MSDQDFAGKMAATIKQVLHGPYDTEDTMSEDISNSDDRPVTQGTPIDAARAGDLDAMLERSRRHSRNDDVRVSMNNALNCQRAALRAIAEDRSSHDVRREVLTAIKHLTVALERLS